MDPRTGVLNALNSGGTHGKEALRSRRTPTSATTLPCTQQLGLAAGACSGNGILLDIKDPVNPKRLDAVNDPNYAYWHSASFSNDGKKVVFTDEWGGGLGARCRANDPNKWGANAIFHLKDNKLSSRATTSCRPPRATARTVWRTTARSFRFPAATSKCRPGTRAASPSWTSPTRSIRLRSPISIAGRLIQRCSCSAVDWSAYWYNGHIYASEIARGLDIFELTPTKFLTQNEIDAAKTVRVAEFNVQNQQKIEWPRKLVVAKAYVDQLERSQALPADQIAALRQAIEVRRSQT